MCRLIDLSHLSDNYAKTITKKASCCRNLNNTNTVMWAHGKVRMYSTPWLSMNFLTQGMWGKLEKNKLCHYLMKVLLNQLAWFLVCEKIGSVCHVILAFMLKGPLSQLVTNKRHSRVILVQTLEKRIKFNENLRIARLGGCTATS